MAGEAIAEKRQAGRVGSHRVVIRIAGDSGDGMQLTGDRFTPETAAFGNDLSTLPDFPAEIRAPAGTLPGVSAFQLHFADHDILTPGDAPDVLVAMNPAALKANLKDLPRGADDHRQHRRVHPARADEGRLRAPTRWRTARWTRTACTAVALTSLTVKALEGHPLSRKEAERAKNMYALGLLSWLYNRPTEPHAGVPASRSSPSEPEIIAANRAAFQAGWNFGETTEEFAVSYEVAPAALPAGTVPQHLRQPGAGLRSDRGIAALRSAAVPGLLPDHPGLGHPARAVEAQELRRAHVPGRGRDRRRSARRWARPSAAHWA